MQSSKFIKALDLAKKAATYAKMPEVNDEDFLDLCLMAEESDDYFFEVVGDTIVMGYLSRLCYNQNYIGAKELFIFSETPSSQTLRLIMKFENWAKKKGAMSMTMEDTAMSPDSFSKYLGRVGYDKVGTVYKKDYI